MLSGGWLAFLATTVEFDPSNLYADTIGPVYRSGPGEVFFVRLEACPEPGSDEFGSSGGAYVNCYIDADDLRTAELRAVALIQANGWQPTRFDTWQLTCAECASASRDPEAPDAASPRELVQQALADGEVCEFYCWPIDAPDADDCDG